ncbi:MAG TPA: hypothetical protein VFH03_18665 [Actinoplanes sp.]|nr:hypothetical protein [Actinoplanes sp.]
MSAGTLTPRLADVPSTAPAPERALSRLAVRLVARGAAIVVAVAAGMSAIVVTSYDSLMADSAAAGSLGALAANPAIRTLFGEPFALDTAGGFTVWRTGTVVAVLIAVWAILAATRITRGEEDAGRWDLLLAGPVPLRTAVAAHLRVVGAVPVLLTVALWAAMAATGAGAGGAAVHAAGVGMAGLFFAGVAALAAQIQPTRAAAVGSAVAVLGVGLLARMIGDGVAALDWLRWTTPFGLLELSRPYAGNRAGPLLLLAAATVVVWATALAVAGRRDVRGGLRAPAAGRPPRTRLLGSVEAFAVRRALRPVGAWSLGIGAYFLLIGLIATTMTDFLADNPAFADAAGAAGFAGLTSVEGYAATLFAVLAVPVGLYAADRVSTFAGAEADRRLTLLAAQPITRRRLVGAEVAAVTAGVVVLTTVAGVAMWSGVVVTGGGLGFAAAVSGVWNTLPIALLSAGAAVLALGWFPRLTGGVGAVPAAGGFLLQVIAESAGAPPWLINLSPYAHLAPVPLASPNLTAAAAMVILAVALTVVGVAGFARRDLRV